ncbi:MAG: hypothetical protein OEV42_10720 [Deltaproteobacteria bacterium]|nr:hypothetical protein [Deltaproteobacteria bacterium]
MAKLNCWEFHNCGREKGGKNVGREGPCPASTFEAAHNFMGGKNGGRACAYITGTFCSQTLQGTQKNYCKPSSDINQLRFCTNCEFYRLLRKEQKDQFSLHNFLLYVKERLISTKMRIGKIEVPQLRKISGKSKHSMGQDPSEKAPKSVK